MTLTVRHPYVPRPWRRAARCAPGVLVLVVLCVGLLAPVLHEFGHGKEVWSLAGETRTDCERHPAGVHVESGFSHLHHAPCALCSRNLAEGVAFGSYVGTRDESTRPVEFPRAAPDDRFEPSTADRGPPVLV